MRFLLEIIGLGLKNLSLHGLRSVLTSLGIILGVAAVIVMVAIGEGTKQAEVRKYQTLGATNIIVRSTRPPERATFGSEERSFVASFGLKYQDLRRLEEKVTDAQFILPLKAVGSEVSLGAQRMTSQTFGTVPELADAANLTLDRGRYLSVEDLERRASVAVIGSEVARKFFRLRDPIGANIRIDQRVFEVVGVLNPIGLAGGSGSPLVGRNMNQDVHIPLTSARDQFGDVVTRRVSGSFTGEEVEIKEIYITAPTTDSVLNMADRVRRVINFAHEDEGDVEIIVPWELLERARRTALVWNTVFIAVAAIGLVIAGIGIMNIMLASVTERTREIGIRRALGATRRHILAQFLVETGSLSAVGGLLGIVLGVGLAVSIGPVIDWLLTLPSIKLLFDADVNIEMKVTTWSVVASFLVATVVGLIFGIYPAAVASRQDPVVALRHD